MARSIPPPSRRALLRQLAAGSGLLALPRVGWLAQRPLASMRLGLVTYMWGADLELPDLLQLCEAAGLLGVELRTTHGHGVEPDLGPSQRAAVRARFADSPVTLVGLGSDERFDSPDPARLRAAVEAAKAFLQLSHDVGGSGVKVKPDSFHEGVPRERTVEQIGRSLNELGRVADGLGQQVRLEVHGTCAHLTTIRSILDVADHPQVVVCWNSNPQDLEGAGLEPNFRLVQQRMGATLHARDFSEQPYPYPELLRLLLEAGYAGWVLVERGPPLPAQRLEALLAQRTAFERLLKRLQGDDVADQR